MSWALWVVFPAWAFSVMRRMTSERSLEATVMRCVTSARDAGRPYPRVRVQGYGPQVVTQAGAVLLVETVRKTGLDQAISQALAPWRKPRAVHDPGKALLDVALAVALGGDCLADVAMLRCEPAMFGAVASDPTVSRLINSLADSGEKALRAIRSARSEARSRTWWLADRNAPDADGQVTVDLDGVLVIAHSDKEDAAATWKKTYGHHPLMAFVDHGSGGTGEPVAALLRPGNAVSNTAADHITTAQAALEGVYASLDAVSGAM